MSDNFFGIKKESYELWKSRPYTICKTPGMTLWVALHNPKLRFMDAPKNWERKVIRAFGSPVEKDCRCKYCRYYRMFK